jgi:hypothetical protein
MSSGVILATLASALALLTLAGCGLEPQPFSAEKEERKAALLPERALITSDDLVDAPTDTARGLVLRWWRAVQTRDPQAVVKSYAPDVRDLLPKGFADAVVVDLAPAAVESTIKLGYLEHTDSGEATVYLRIYSPDARLDGPLALPLKKFGDEWRITDTTFLDTLATAYLAAEEATATAGGEQ